MSIQQKFLLIFFGAIVTLLVVLEAVDFNNRLDKAVQTYYQNNRTDLNAVLRLQQEALETVALELSNDAVVKKAYKSDDPRLIIDDKLPFWEKVREQRLIHEIHFFKPPAISFVNFSNFNAIGTNVADVRSDIVWITSSFEPSTHMMMCKTYPGIRATHPIVDEEGNILGGLSVGKKVDWIPQTLKEMTGNNAFLLYTAESASHLAPKYYETFIKDKTRRGELILADKTFDFDAEVIERLDFSLPVQEVEINGEPYSVNIFRLPDFDRKTLGYIVTANSLDGFYTTFYRHIFETIAILLLAGGIFYILIRHHFVKLLARIEAMRNLTDDYHRKRFETLDSIDIDMLKRENPKDEVRQLERDIILMGNALRSSYNELESEVDKKTHQLYELNAQLLLQLYTDSLTGIPNRNAFFRDLKIMDNPCLAIININGFKNINDTYGIDIGNRLLKESANQFVSRARIYNLNYYRLGSDEIALLIDDEDTTAFKEAVIDIVNGVERHCFIFEAEEAQVYVDYTVGISFEKENIVEKADMALLAARKGHRKHRVFSEKQQLHKLHSENIELTNTIRYAVYNDGIAVYFQPIVDGEGVIVKYESLVRLIDGERVLTPYHFLELAMKTRYYQEISRIVIDKSFEQFRERTHCFSINLSASDILNRKTLAYIKEKLRAFPEPSRVIFEIVESESITDLPEVETFISEIKSMGAKIAIDDFGAGYSNFSYLLKLRPDILKIDGSLIKQIDTDRNAYNITKTIVSFAKTLQLRTIAEFIHSEAVLEIAKELEIDEFQGFYFGEPGKTPLERERLP